MLLTSMGSHLHTENHGHLFSSESSVNIGAISQYPNDWEIPMIGLSEAFAVEHAVVSPCNGAYGQSTRGKTYRQPTIEILPDDTLLEIFNFYRLHAMQTARGRPWKWQCLAHVCRRWRRIVSDSPRRLQLRIIFKSRMPMKSILDSWPSLPLVVRYSGSQKSKPTSKALNNIIFALRHPHRVCEINLGVTRSMFGAIVEVIQQPFPALEHIRIKSIDTTGSPPVLPDTLLGGFTPRLSTIRFYGIAFPFPALQQLLFSASGLVTLDLHIPSTGYFSPKDFATGLSALVRLISLELRFHFPTSHPTLKTAGPPTALARTTLRSVTHFAFHGASEYFEDLATRINLPALNHSSITFFNQLTFEVPQLCQFIEHVDALRSPDKVIVTFSRDYVQSSLFRRGKPQMVKRELCITISCKQLDWQLSSTAQIFSQLSPLLSSVEILYIQGDSPSTDKDQGDIDPTELLELFQLFGTVRVIIVSKQLGPDVALALGTAVTAGMSGQVLPNLNSLHLSSYRKSPPAEKAAEQFVATLQRLRPNPSIPIYLTG